MLYEESEKVSSDRYQGTIGADLPGETGAAELRREMASTAVSEPDRMAVSLMEAALKELTPFSLCSVMLPPKGSDPARQNPPEQQHLAELMPGFLPTVRVQTAASMVLVAHQKPVVSLCRVTKDLLSSTEEHAIQPISAVLKRLDGPCETMSRHQDTQ